MDYLKIQKGYADKLYKCMCVQAKALSRGNRQPDIALSCQGLKRPGSFLYARQVYLIVLLVKEKKQSIDQKLGELTSEDIY